MMGYWGFWNGFSWIMMIIPILLIGVIIFAVYKLIQHSRDGYEVQKGNDPLATLNRRYANGELSDEDYLRMKKNILQK